MVRTVLLLLALTVSSDSLSLSIPRKSFRKHLSRRKSCPFHVASQPSTNIGIQSQNTRHYAQASRMGSGSERNNGRIFFGWMRNSSNISVTRVLLAFQRLARNFTKQMMMLMFAVGVMFAGTTSLHTPPSHARQLQTNTVLVSSGVAHQRQLDKIVDDYVVRHMFDTEHYDAFESAYKEAYADSLTETNPTRDILKREGILAADEKSADDATKNAISKGPLQYISNLPNLLSEKAENYAVENLKMDPTSAKGVVSIIRIIGTPIAFIYTLLFASGGFRALLMGKQSKQYGNKRDLSTTEKDPEDYDDDDDDDSSDDSDEPSEE